MREGSEEEAWVEDYDGEPFADEDAEPEGVPRDEMLAVGP